MCDKSESSVSKDMRLSLGFISAVALVSFMRLLEWKICCQRANGRKNVEGDGFDFFDFTCGIPATVQPTK